MRQTRIAEVNMFVDHTGEEVTSFCVDGGVGGKYRSDVASDENLFDAIVFDDDATELTAPLVDEDGIFDKRSVVHKILRLLCACRGTKDIRLCGV